MDGVSGGDGGGSFGGGDVSSSTPAADVPVADATPAEAPVESAPADVAPIVVATQTEPAATKRDPRTLLTKALEALQVGKKKKLDKVVELAKKEGKISNDDVQLALRVSHATATRYLVQLTKEGRLKRVGSAENAVYEPA